MSRKKYKIEYIPIADRDLAEIFTHMAVGLDAPQAAADLLESMEQAVKSLETFPYAHTVYQPVSLKSQITPFEYRSLIVDSFIIFYYVTENTVTIARVMYGKRDIRNAL